MWRVAAPIVLCLAACPAAPDRVFCEPGLPCAEASPAHCAAGPEAERHGRATFADGTCVATDDATCRASSVTCRLWGQCHAPVAGGHAGACGAKDDRDFAASRSPACAVGTCVALADDCRDAGVCALEGRCTARDGVCVADAAACKASELCKTLGWCSLAGAECRPASAADCQRAASCTAWGNCAFAGGRCLACARAPECRQSGLCQRVGTQCKATDPRHCQASAACTREGRCRAFQGACVK